MRELLQVVVCVVLLARADARVVDLTHKLDEDAVTWFGNPVYNFTVLTKGYFGTLWFENNHIAMAEHTGSHIDAPGHLGNEGQWLVDDIPMENLIGPGVVIDVKEKVRNNPDYSVTVEDLTNWEEKYGNIPKGSIILMNSGWAERYLAKDSKKVFGLTGNNLANSSDYHFPAFSVEAIKWLLTNRDFHAVGVDTPSTDIGQSTTYDVHVQLGRNQKVGVEGVAYLDNLPENGSNVFIGVLKIKDGSGGPARIFALVDDPKVSEANLGSNLTSQFGTMVMALLFMSTIIM